MVDLHISLSSSGVLISGLHLSPGHSGNVPVNCPKLLGSFQNDFMKFLMSCEVKIKIISNMFINLIIKQNKSPVYGIIFYVALVLGTCSQIARHRLCGCDASGVSYLLMPCDIGLFSSTQWH